MNKQFYFLSPVEVVKVSKDNLEEVAEWCGGSVQETETRRGKPGTMDKYVHVPVPNERTLSWAFPGMFITRRLVVTVKDEMKFTFAVFKRDYFEKNYFEAPKEAVDKTWEREAQERSKPAKKVKVTQRNTDRHLTVNVGEKFLEAQRLLAASIAMQTGVSDEKVLEILSDKNAEAENEINKHRVDEDQPILEGFQSIGDTPPVTSTNDLESVPDGAEVRDEEFLSKELEGKSEAEVEAACNGSGA